MKIAWSPRAVAHLADVRAYIADENPAAASHVAAVLPAAIERLASLPNIGRPGRVTGTRELVVSGTPYVVPYRLRGESLEIIAVFHGRQRWPRRFQRLALVRR